MSDWVLIAFVMVTELMLHYIPWRQFLRGCELPRPAAYALGVIGMMGPFTVWLMERCHIEIAIMLWLVILAGGMAVLGGYGADAIRDLYWREREAREREQEARRDA